MVVIASSKLAVEEVVIELDGKILKTEDSITRSWKRLASDGWKRKEIERFLSKDLEHLAQLYKEQGEYEEAIIKVVPHRKGLHVMK